MPNVSALVMGTSMENKCGALTLGQTHTQQGWVCLPWPRMVAEAPGVSQHVKEQAIVGVELSV